MMKLLLLLYSCFFMFLFMILYQIYSLTKMKSKLFYLFLLSLAIVAFYYEGNSLSCSPNNCSLEKNKKSIKGDKFACREVNRVNWRRSLLISFIVFAIMNNITPFDINILPFILSFFAIYFYFNFDTYHRFNIACEMEKNGDKNKE